MGKFGITSLLIVCALQWVCSSDDKALGYRPLKIDDIITPSDFLPIAKRLIEKVENPGAGKGIVSSANSQQQLADKLFQRFFFTNARYTTIREQDIESLDAIQALALSGDEYDPTIHYLPLNRKSIRINTPQRCRYSLVTRKKEQGRRGKKGHKKAVTEEKKAKDKIKLVRTNHDGRIEITQKNKGKTEASTDAKTLMKNKLRDKSVRQKREASSKNSTGVEPHVIPEAKKLMKNRVMIVKTDRRKRETILKETGRKVNDTTAGKKQKNRKRFPQLGDQNPAVKMYDVEDRSYPMYVDVDIYRLLAKQPPKDVDKKNCYWQYKCRFLLEEPIIFCDLIPECLGTKSDHFIRDDIPIAHSADEHDPGLMHFRREVGVFLVDEEVEKIFERRYYSRKKQRGKMNPRESEMEKKHRENLQIYFSNLIYAQKLQTTTRSPMVKEKVKKPVQKFEHKYKYLKKNYDNDKEMQKKIKESRRQAKAKAEVQHKDGDAVISITTPITTPLPNFMHTI